MVSMDRVVLAKRGFSLLTGLARSSITYPEGLTDVWPMLTIGEAPPTLLCNRCRAGGKLCRYLVRY